MMCKVGKKSKIGRTELFPEEGAGEVISAMETEAEDGSSYRADQINRRG